MWLILYENLKIFGREMNEIYKFEGVTKPTFYQRSVVINLISHRWACRMRSMGQGLAQFCLINYVGHYH